MSEPKIVRSWDTIPPVLWDGEEAFSLRVLEKQHRDAEAEAVSLRARVEELEKENAWTPMYLKSLNARATVEQELFNVANGKTPIPDREQFRQWALKLGVPDGWGSEQYQAARGKPNE